jgi:hypothetical protein
MEEQFLNELGRFIQARVRREILTPRARFTKSGDMPKPNSPYNFNASGRLYNSVDYAIVEGLIYIIMEDYGVENVFSDLLEGDSGSWPGQGRWAVDTRPPEAKQKYSALLAALENWVREKIGLQGAKAKSMAFAVRKNLFRAGYKGLPLITDQFRDDVFTETDRLLNEPQYEGFAVKDILDRFTLIGKTSYDFNIRI